MMRIISFDVGIKNMAYCLMEIGGDTTRDASSIQILQWNVLNLSGEDAPTSHLCTCITGITKKTPNGKICGKKAKYGGPCGSGSDVGHPNLEKFCLKHATSHERWRLPKKETKLTELKKKKVEELAMEWKKIELAAKPGTRLDGCTILMRKQELIDCLAKYYSETEFTILPVAKQRKAVDINLIEIGQNIRIQLDNYLGNMRLDYVIIENQISTIATRMKTIQGMLAQYFIMRQNGGGEPQPHIEFISSHNKLKGFALEHNVESTQEHDKKKYKANKMNGVDICRRFLDANSAMAANWKDEFEKNGKKDDLADGFLQGIFYLKREKIISYAENLKINSV